MFMPVKKTSRRYALSQFDIHGEMMLKRYRDKSIKFEYYCEEYKIWREASVPQWEEETKYRIKK